MHENNDELLDRSFDPHVGSIHVGSAHVGSAHVGSAHVGSAHVESVAAPSAADYRMRCPKCRKLYSIGASQIGSLETLKFECSTCSTRFVAHRPEEVLAASSAEQGQETFWLLTEIENLQPKPLPFSAKLAALDFETEKSLESCPKCGSKTAPGTTECRGCGILYSKVHSPAAVSADLSLPRGVDLSGRRDLMDLWERVVGNWENESAHDRFVHACNKAGSLAWASVNYARILDVSPHEEMAKKMKRKLVALAEIQAQRNGVQTPSRLPFGMSSMSNMAVFLGAIVMMTGLILPSMERMTGIGLSMILLSIGVRLVMLKRN